jgi:hypothetical protein
MKPVRTIFLLITAFTLIAILASGCIKIVTDDSTTGNTKAPNEPILGEWSMTRTAIDPKLPIPDILVSQVVPQTSTWKFQRASGKLTLRYDGNDTWYKIPLGVSIKKKTVTVSENSGKAPYLFTGGGSIDLSQISAIISQAMGQKIEQTTIDFNDEIAVSFIQGNNSKIRAVITVNASGKYYGEMETGGMKWKNLQQNLAITYDGIKK